ncbi:serine O-acetyltransferase EpsC [uncultured Winogradskyella sp.]|uniref:serine O-acetyltransferase EpsC n=1 Tax=uncultured Winogradskyella sp. TaxID=395353 RepID=UPI002614687C|nr:serine O-acetyltransferase EpsC [uncultured Winogradskyella sp.]|tara:strand:+ start:12433 stop:13179 length:747 start_codon:yes stop_codon:yes gene_type:complete
MNSSLHIPKRFKEDVEDLAKDLFYLVVESDVNQDLQLELLKDSFFKISEGLECGVCETKWSQFKTELKTLKPILRLDAQAAYNNDPAAKSLREVYLAYPGFYAITMYRISHILWDLDIPVLPRMISEYAHSVTGTDIHPGAEIGKSFFIDHATGVVIGETAVIHNNVTIYQGVTLGGIKVEKALKGIKRHPTIMDNVTIYANATILGGDVVIGANSVIGANVWITQSIPEDSTVTYKSDIRITNKKEE